MSQKPVEITRAEDRRLVNSLTCALIITLFLFYIDEGYYNFKWMADLGNWVPFFFYTGFILGIQLIISELVLMKFSVRVKSFSIPISASVILILLLVSFSK